MSRKWRRFEVLLPTQFNDGRDVPAAWLVDALLEAVQHFGAASYEKQHVEGHWQHAGVTYRDKLARLIIDVRDTAANRKWMKASKQRWMVQLEQIDLWMASYLITIE